MILIVNVKNLLILHVVEEPVVQNSTLLENVPPESLYALIVGTPARYKATSTHSSVRMLKHEPCHTNILPTSVTPHSTR